MPVPVSDPGCIAPPSSKTGLADIEDVVPFLRHLATEGWWATGQTVLINGGYTTK